MNNKKRDLKVYPLNIDTSRVGEIYKGGVICNLPHLILVVGRVRAGKTVLLNNLYLNPNFYADDFKVKILISPSCYNDVMYQHMVEHFDFVFDEYSDSLIDELLNMINEDETDDKYLIIFDDIVGSTVGSKKGKPDKITALSTKFRHIGNKHTEGKLSLVITTQYFKYITPILRTQASGVYIMGAFSETELKKISEAYEFFGGSKHKFLELHKTARKGEFDFLFLNCHDFEAYQNHENKLWSMKDSYNNIDETKQKKTKQKKTKSKIITNDIINDITNDIKNDKIIAERKPKKIKFDENILILNVNEL
jgi:hypothetical protein